MHLFCRLLHITLTLRVGSRLVGGRLVVASSLGISLLRLCRVCPLGLCRVPSLRVAFLRGIPLALSRIASLCLGLNRIAIWSC